jgi:hypothetical protein
MAETRYPNRILLDILKNKFSLRQEGSMILKFNVATWNRYIEIRAGPRSGGVTSRGIKLGVS